MRVHTTLGPLILSAGLCAARACAPHPRSTTTLSWTSETATSTAIGSTATEIATTASGLTSEETTIVTEYDTAIESSLTILSSATETSTGETSAFETTTAEASISTVQASTLTIEASTSATEAPTRTTEDSTTTTTSPAQSVQSPPNGDFEDPTLEPWVSTGTTAVLAQGGYCYEKNQCARLPGPYSGNTAKICQSVGIDQGYEYTFSAYLRQSCTYDAGESEPIDCNPNVNSVQLSIDGAAFASFPVDWDNQYHKYSTVFRYTGPDIESTDLCISASITQGNAYEFFVDAVSLLRGDSVPVPEES
ncbi:Ff.00g113270.m01.CDS01 [Fusarium sp. VM40]|nr:Ff.00g113270.m01.CDS01 [Fusarium sp. VM40]